jgi:hypothetical protein
MTATNHILVGSIIGLTIDRPVLALALALISHFVLDALPHFGYPGNKGYGEAMKHKQSIIVSAADLVIFSIIILVLVFSNEWFALTTGLFAIAPDMLGIYNYLVFEKNNKSPSNFVRSVHINFHRKLQRYERPWGMWVELVVFLVLVPIFVHLLKA